MSDPSSCIDLDLPFNPKGKRVHELWKNTAFEFFLSEKADGPYFEFNFSTSGDWNAYQFSDTRQAMSPLRMTPPELSYSELKQDQDSDVTQTFRVTLNLDFQHNFSPRLCLMPAVLKLKTNALTYWSHLHGKEKPDFHDRSLYAKFS